MDGWITIGTKLDTKKFDEQITQVERRANEIEKELSDNKELGFLSDREVAELNVELEKTKNKLVQLRQQKEKFENPQGIRDLGNSFQSLVKKASKLALGIFGIRSAYMALRRASSDLASYDTQYATNLEYIRFVLTQAIAPVLRYIVNLAGTLLKYIYAILNGWFGIGAKLDLSAEAFNKMKKGAGGVSKAVKEISKELLGFDEINRLTGQTNGGVSAGAGGVGISDFDLGNIEDVPRWVKWIIDNKKLILDVLGTIAAVLATLKIVSFLSGLKSIFSVLKGMGALQIFGLITGVAITIMGIKETIPALITFIKNPSWNKFGNLLGEISTILIGIGTVLISIMAKNPAGWIILVTGAVVNLVSALLKDKAQILSVKDAQEKLNQAMQKTKETTDAYIKSVEGAEEAEKNLINIEKKNKLSGEELYKAVQNGTMDFKTMSSAQREVYKAYVDNKNAQDELAQSIKNLNNAKKEEAKASLEVQLSIAQEAKQYDGFRISVNKAYEEGKISSKEARDYLERAMAGMSAASKKTFLEDIPSNIRAGLDPYKYDSIFNKFKNKWNPFMKSLNKEIDIMVNFHLMSGGGGRRRSAEVGGGGRAKGGIFYPSKLPRLALGGIINQPGRGIPYNGAIIGERGAEAVVPLTDNQQMELLGRTIGKYITVNATVVNSMNGRVISRELKQVQSEQNFAYNM